MNLLTMAKIGAFFQSHPGLIPLLNSFPKFRPETGRMLLDFLERALREDDPEAYIVRSLRAALDAPSNVRTVVVSKT